MGNDMSLSELSAAVLILASALVLYSRYIIKPALKRYA